jgi:hypothetical protein
MALNELTAQFARKPLEFMRVKSMNPPAVRAGFRRQQTIAINSQSLRFFGKEVREQQKKLESRFTSATTEAPIGWIGIMPDETFIGGVKFDVEFASDSVDYESRVQAENRLPVYYLPWEPDYLLRMHIPRYRVENVSLNFGGAVDLDPYSPHIFFTAGLSGCSVFVYGDPREPVVTHAGTVKGTPYGDDCARFWREILFLERFQRLQHEGCAHEVNVDHYMGNTLALKSFKQWLENKPSEFTVEHIVNFGAVFGIRHGALWSFYLQENADVTRFKMVKETKTVPKQVQIVETQKSPLSSLGIRLFDKQVTKTVTVQETVTVEKKKKTYNTIPINVRRFIPEIPAGPTSGTDSSRTIAEADSPSRKRTLARGVIF